MRASRAEKVITTPADYKKSASCFSCKDKFDEKESSRHVAGFGVCEVFRTALEAKRTWEDQEKVSLYVEL